MNTYIAINSSRQTQLFATNNNTSEFEFRLWSSIANMQDGERWLCLVAPSNLPEKNVLIAAGINVNRMLVVHTQDNQQAIQCAEKALKLGKCSAVVSWVSTMSNPQKSLLEEAAESGSATSLVIKENVLIQPSSMVA